MPDASEGRGPERQTSARGEFCCLSPCGLSVASSAAVQPGLLDERKTVELAKQIQCSALLVSDGWVLFQQLCTHTLLCGSSALEMEHERLHKSQAHLDPTGFYTDMLASGPFFYPSADPANS